MLQWFMDLKSNTLSLKLYQLIQLIEYQFIWIFAHTTIPLTLQALFFSYSYYAVIYFDFDFHKHHDL